MSVEINFSQHNLAWHTQPSKTE